VPADPEHPLTYDDLLQIVELVKASEQFSEFRLKVGEIEIELRRRGAGEPPRAPVPASLASSPPANAFTQSGTSPIAASSVASPPSLAAVDARPCTADAFDTSKLPPEAIIIRAPMVGTFYRAPAPGAPAFVTEGQAVEPETTVCIIEVMKLMNSIPAGARGSVRRILVADGAAVEAGAPLVVLDPR
jgi:acetyl-CoA carboxylase biotin carboxyl carrier protein